MMYDQMVKKVRVSVLITCFNRKEKTLQCLASVFLQNITNDIEMKVFLVDDGSRDGTSDEVRVHFPQVHIISGDGSLFWAGGMRKAWHTAMTIDEFDFFWLVNDDTKMFPNALEQLLNANEYACETFGKSGIYSGCTLDPLSRKTTYGGEKLVKSDNYASVPVHPNGSFQKCDFLNANCLLIPRSVVDLIGVFSEKYIQSIADYDYSMRVVKAGLPVLIVPDYAGECEYDHTKFEEGEIPSLSKRIQTLYGPKGYSYHEFLYFVKTFFPKRYLNTIVTFWLRTLFPKFWRFLKK